MNRIQMFSLVTAVVLTGSTLSALPAFAADSTTSNGNMFSNFVSFFSQKFGLDKTQVQTAMNEFHANKKENHEQNYADHQTKRLDALVKDGKITQAQKQAILTELAALHTKYSADSFKNLTADQKKKRMQEEKTELEAWAKSQNIDASYVLPGFPMGMGMGMNGRMKRLDKWGGNVGTPSPKIQQ